MSIKPGAAPVPLIQQLYFVRSELQRGLAGLTPAAGETRMPPLNSISWMVGHLAWQEQGYWLFFPRGEVAVPALDALVGFGKPASTPPLEEMWTAWHEITSRAETYLGTLTQDDLGTHMIVRGERRAESIGTMLLRVIYHYWYHIGEALAVRQMLGHTDLPQFVGALGRDAPYRPE